MLDLRYRTILAVAVPLMVSSFIQSVVFLTDAAFLSRYSTLAFDANGNAGLIYVTVFAALTGMSDGSQILIARRIGENRIDAIGRIFGTSAFTLMCFGLLLFMLIYFLMPQLLPLYTRNQALAEAQISFLSIRSFALLIGIVTLTIQAFFYAIGKTWVMLLSALIVAVSNVLMDYLFIFGWKFIPSMGLEGAALASTLADGLGMTFLVLFLVFSKEVKKYQLFSHFAFQWKSFIELIKVGSPLLMQSFMALATWTIFFTWIEQMGKDNLTISQNIRAIYFLAFIPIWGFAATTKTYISQYIGRQDFDALKVIQRRIQLLSVLFLLVFFHGAFLYPEKLIAIINPQEIYIEKSAAILRFVAGSIFIFSLASVKFQTVNGSGNTQVAFAIELICTGIYAISAFLLIKVWKLDILWVWTVEYIYFCFLGLVSIIYLRFFNWKNRLI